MTCLVCGCSASAAECCELLTKAGQALEHLAQCNELISEAAHELLEVLQQAKSQACAGAAEPRKAVVLEAVPDVCGDFYIKKRAVEGTAYSATWRAPLNMGWACAVH